MDIYLDHLRQLPFVRSAEVRTAEDVDELELKTASGRFVRKVQLYRTHLSRQLAERAIAHVGEEPSEWIVFAPAVGEPLAELFDEAGLAYVDRAGNCSIRLDDRYVATRRGRVLHRDVEGLTGLRAAGYQTLFALLAEPELLGSTVRELAAHAGVSRQPAHEIRRRLASMRLAERKGRRYEWTANGQRDAFDMWIAAYPTVLRPDLLIGRYRTRETTPPELEAQLEDVLGPGAFCWGGGAAMQRLTGYYRGERTVIHVADSSLDFKRALSAAPAGDASNLYVFGAPGSLGCRGPIDDVAHPLLVYAELLCEHSSRGRDAARELFVRHPPPWETRR